MPVAPTIPNQPYPTIGDVLHLARVIVNDAFGPNGVSGDLLSSSNATTVVLLNSAWGQLQDELADAAVETFTKEIILSPLPAVTTSDPSVSVYIAWDGYFDGAIWHNSGVGLPSLPYDMIQPAAQGVWERAYGSGAPYTIVTPNDAGLPEGYQTGKLRWYEWRDDKLFFKGATVSIELKLRYLAYRPDLGADNVLPINEAVLVPVMRSKRAMAYLVASEFARLRGSEVADNLYAMAEAEIEKLTRRSSHRKASISYRRKAFGS